MSGHLETIRLRHYSNRFLAGFSGNFIKEGCKQKGIQTNFIEIDGYRINLKLKSTSRRSTVSKEDCLFSGYFEENLQDEDVVFLAGNAGNGMDHS